MGARRNETEERLAQVRRQQQKDVRSVEQVVEDALVVLKHESRPLLTLSGEPLREAVNRLVPTLSVDTERKVVELSVALPVWATARRSLRVRVAPRVTRLGAVLPVQPERGLNAAIIDSRKESLGIGGMIE